MHRVLLLSCRDRPAALTDLPIPQSTGLRARLYRRVQSGRFGPVCVPTP